MWRQDDGAGADNTNVTGETFAAQLRSARAPDGGFGPHPGLPAEPEPTALATIALDDAEGRAWLEGRQQASGAIAFDAAVVVNDSATALAAVALEDGGARARALDHVEGSLARTTPSTASVPHDESVHGWAWTEGTFGWVEPTSRAILALRLLRPRSAAIDDGVGMLRDRESVGGGWNYGNRVVFDVDLPPYAQTTAAALIALQGADAELESRGLAVLHDLWRAERGGALSVAMAAAALHDLWRAERDGALSIAMATVALRLHDDADAAEAERALARAFGAGAPVDTVALAWAAIATGPALERLRAAVG